MRRRLPQLLLVGALALAATAGFFAAGAAGIGTQTATTVTISVTNGATGPAGPAGPRGPAGPTGPQGAAGQTCPSGYTEGVLVINHPGGQVSVFGCLKS